VLAARLGLVGSLSEILFLGLVLLLIGCVRTCFILLEVANELRVNAD